MLFFFLAAAVYTDLREEKIYNGCIAAGWAAALLCNLADSGLRGIPLFLCGAGTALPLFLLFLFRMLGAGDIKLLSVVGGFAGPEAGFRCILYSFLCGAVLSAAVLALNGDIRERFQYLFSYMKQYGTDGERRAYRKPGKRRPEHIHFSVAVLMGVLLWAGGF